MKLLKTGFIIIFLTAMISLPSFCFSEETVLPTPVGKVVWINGSLRAVMPNKEERVLQKSSVIYLGDTLMTGDNSQAEIVFTDKTLMTFRPDTTFYVDQYKYNPNVKSGSAGKYVMRLIEGGFRTITGLIAKQNPPDYQVNTPVATIGVRGTDYAVYYHNGQMYVGYYEGRPCIRGQKNGELCLDAQTPYGFVPAANAVPVPVSERPDVFQEKLEITAATVAPFVGGAGGDQVVSPSHNGPITSFCITN